MNFRNLTSLPCQVFLWVDKEARDQCSVFVKATCLLSTGALVETQQPLSVADVLAPSGAITAPADVVPCRTGTSVIVRGSVWAPRGEPAAQVHARVRVGPLEKRLVAFGPRTWTKRGGEYVPSAPASFVSVPATLEYAFGGSTSSESVRTNPIGVGLVSDDERATGRALPALEDPNALLKTWQDRPGPASLDAIPALFAPRLERAGTYDETWRRKRAPLLPNDFDDRYFDVASDGMVARPFLRGGEPIELDGLRPEGPIRACVPRIPIRIDIANRRELPDVDLLVIDPDADVVTVTFRRTCDVSTAGLALPRITVLLLERKGRPVEARP